MAKLSPVEVDGSIRRISAQGVENDLSGTVNGPGRRDYSRQVS